MTVADLQYGDTFYFTQWPTQFFIYLGLWDKSTEKIKKARCVPAGKLYAKYFSIKKEVVKVL